MRKLFLKRVPDTVRVEPYLPELRGECGDLIRMAMSDRDDGVSSVKVGVFNPVLVPEFCTKSPDRFNIP